MRIAALTCITVLLWVLYSGAALAVPTGASEKIGPDTTASQPIPPGGGSESIAKDSALFGGLTNLYAIGLSLVGVSALFMIIWGGIYILIAGDNSSFLTKGKEKITNALWGILIAAISYALLRTINPDLVTLRLNTPTTQTENP